MNRHVTTFSPDDRELLACSGCGGTYTHLAAYQPYIADEPGRLSIELTFTCELCGETFTIDLRQHKGETEVTPTTTTLRLAFNGWTQPYSRPTHTRRPADRARQALADHSRKDTTS